MAKTGRKQPTFPYKPGCTTAYQCIQRDRSLRSADRLRRDKISKSICTVAVKSGLWERTAERGTWKFIDPDKLVCSQSAYFSRRRSSPKEIQRDWGAPQQAHRDPKALLAGSFDGKMHCLRVRCPACAVSVTWILPSKFAPLKQ